MSRASSDPRAGFDPDQPLDPSRALTPVAVRVNERRVARGLLPKLRRVAARIPFAADLVSLWYCARDPETPAGAKALMMAGLAYFVLPADAIPDMIAGIGFTDDAAVIAVVLAAVGRHLKPRHKDAARAWLTKLARDV
jgi:uncharacterized membrane protein YkvA (DUF1232 family)